MLLSGDERPLREIEHPTRATPHLRCLTGRNGYKAAQNAVDRGRVEISLFAVSTSADHLIFFPHSEFLPYIEPVLEVRPLDSDGRQAAHG